MVAQLTAGSCFRLHHAKPDDTEILSSPHTLQILSVRKVVSTATAANPNAIDRYRIVLSDGIHFVQAMLATQLNDLVNDGAIAKHTIVVTEKLSCSYLSDKRLIIILGLRVLENAADKIGEPTKVNDEADEQAGVVTPAPPTIPPPAVIQRQAPATNPRPPPQQQPQPQQSSRTARNGSIYPIESLSPYQNNWTIKARVTQKSDIKQWSNTRGEGKLFNVTFMDESGEIRGTAFNLVVDELYPKLEEGKVYYISKARVNLAKKKFSNLTNDYELSLERNTEVEECLETSNLPMVKFNFVPLGNLESLPKDSTCDVIGVVKDVSPLSEILSKQTNKMIVKRELTLVDKSGFSVRLTLWGKQAEQFTAEDSPVIAFKGVKVGDYGGRSLSMFSSSTMQINPDIEECFALRGWYDSQGAVQSFQAHSSMGGMGRTGGFNRAEVRSIHDVKESQIGEGDKPGFFSVKATILHIKSDNISYPACPTTGCNKKVLEDNGSWRCEKCNLSFEAPEHRYILSMAVADHSGQAWLQGFNDVGVVVFGMSANEIVRIKEEDEDAYNAVMAKANFATYNFSCRAKQDTFNEVTRVRYGISQILPLDYKEEASALRDILHSSWAQ